MCIDKHMYLYMINLINLVDMIIVKHIYSYMCNIVRHYDIGHGEIKKVGKPVIQY